MSTPTLNLFPSHVPVGTVQVPDQNGSQKQYDVTMSAEFVRALSALFERVGGATGMSSDDIALLATFSTPPDLTAIRAVEDIQIDRSIGYEAEIATMKRAMEDMQAQFESVSGLVSSLATLRHRIEDVEVVASYRDVFRVNWERPGTLGSLTANSVAATTLTASAAVTLSPANANVVISPSGTGIVTINPATVGSINNMVIGGSTAKAINGTVIVGTTYNGNTITTGTGTLTLGSATLNIGTGGTLGSAAFTSSSAYVPAMSPVASGGAVATTASTNVAPYGFTTNTQADSIVTKLNLVISALVGDSIMS